MILEHRRNRSPALECCENLSLPHRLYQQKLQSTSHAAGAPLLLDLLGAVKIARIALDIGKEDMTNFDGLGWVLCHQAADGPNTTSKVRPRSRRQPEQGAS